MDNIDSGYNNQVHDSDEDEDADVERRHRKIISLLE
jgi:hypothetical protein